MTHTLLYCWCAYSFRVVHSSSPSNQWGIESWIIPSCKQVQHPPFSTNKAHHNLLTEHEHMDVMGVEGTVCVALYLYESSRYKILLTQGTVHIKHTQLLFPTIASRPDLFLDWWDRRKTWSSLFAQSVRPGLDCARDCFCWWTKWLYRYWRSWRGTRRCNWKHIYKLSFGNTSCSNCSWWY